MSVMSKSVWEIILFRICYKLHVAMLCFCICNRFVTPVQLKAEFSSFFCFSFCSVSREDTETAWKTFQNKHTIYFHITVWNIAGNSLLYRVSEQMTKLCLKDALNCCLSVVSNHTCSWSASQIQTSHVCYFVLFLP